ncbi:ABC transporter substrate-binding protein [Mesorhizobium atlanticum]
MSQLIRMSRRGLLASGGKAAVFVAATGIAPQFIRPGRAFAADALAPGMIGGPTGFDGAERYQYGPDTPEGRAIEAAKALKAAGKAPAKIVLGLSDGSIGQLTKPFPAGAPSIKDLWEKETGIAIEIVGLPNGQEFTKTMQDISTKGGAYDIYSTEWNRLGDLAETGGIAKLDDFVAKHKPEWDDPKQGYVNGAKGVSLLNQYRGSTYGVSLDGDFQTWVYRTDLFGDAAEQKAFKDKHGYDLAPPKTWKQHSDVAAFFQRPDKGLFGSTDLRNQGWGYTNWYQRFVSMASPNQFLFGDDGKPLINSAQGIAATKEYVESLAHHSPDAISWGWPEQYGNFAKGGAAMTCAFSNLPKFLDNTGNKDSAVTGKIGSMLPAWPRDRRQAYQPLRSVVLAHRHGVVAVEESGGRLPSAAVAGVRPHLCLDECQSRRLSRSIPAVGLLLIRSYARPITPTTWMWCAKRWRARCRPSTILARPLSTTRSTRTSWPR